MKTIPSLRPWWWISPWHLQALPGGPAQYRRVLFLFLLLSFSIIFEIFGEIKNTQIWKFHFWKMFRLKICSIRNMFTFEFHVQIQKKCSNSNLFRFKFVQARICSDSNLFKLEFVQTQICSDSNLFKLKFVQIRICSNSILFRFKFVQTWFYWDLNLFKLNFVQTRIEFVPVGSDRRDRTKAGRRNLEWARPTKLSGEGRRGRKPENRRGSYTPPVGGAGTRGRVPRVRGCLVGPRPMRFTIFVFSFFSNFNKIRNINNF
jgi:hypothetical protein